MEAYRDQYATIFKGGKGVTVIGISTDDDTVQFNWAHEKKFPVLFASDPKGETGKLYDAKIPLMNYEKRDVFVIGPDGRVTKVIRGFKELSAAAYTELGDAVQQAMSPSRE